MFRTTTRGDGTGTSFSGRKWPVPPRCSSSPTQEPSKKMSVPHRSSAQPANGRTRHNDQTDASRGHRPDCFGSGDHRDAHSSG
jgi:hypothetical protein